MEREKADVERAESRHGVRKKRTWSAQKADKERTRSRQEADK